MSRAMSLAAYRTLLRSARIAFQGNSPSPDHILLPRRSLRFLVTNPSVTNERQSSHLVGDSFALSAARTEARKGFEQNRQAELSADEWTKAVRYAEDVARLLRENVVQGRRTPDGSGNISTYWNSYRAKLLQG